MSHKIAFPFIPATTLPEFNDRLNDLRKRVAHALSDVAGTEAATVTPTTFSSVSPVEDQTTANFFICNATTGTVRLVLPNAVNHQAALYFFKKIDSSGNTVIVATEASQNIDGSATYTLSSQYQAVTVASNGTQWYIMSVFP